MLEIQQFNMFLFFSIPSSNSVLFNSLNCLIYILFPQLNFKLLKYGVGRSSQYQSILLVLSADPLDSRHRVSGVKIKYNLDI